MYFDDRKIDIHFTDGLKSLPKTHPQIIPLSPDEIEKILAVHIEYGLFRGKSANPLNLIYGTFTEFMAKTGARFNEVASLKVKNLDLANGKAIFMMTKNKQNHQVYLTKTLIIKLQELIKNKFPDDFVFTNLPGSRVHAPDYSNDLKIRARMAGITKRVYPHLLRHSYGSDLANNDVRIEEIAHLLNHKDIQTTYETYAHFADNKLRQASNCFSLNQNDISPQDRIVFIEEAIGRFRLEKDKRFDYVKVKEAINTFTSALYRAIL